VNTPLALVIERGDAPAPDLAASNAPGSDGGPAGVAPDPVRPRLLGRWWLALVAVALSPFVIGLVARIGPVSHGEFAGDRALIALSVPFCVYAIWSVVVRVRVGAWPSQGSQGRFTFPGVGLAHAVFERSAGPSILPWLAVGLVFALGAMMLARHDVLTWIALAYVCLASVLGADAWVINQGFVRTLVPMFVFGGVAFAGGVRTHLARRDSHTEPDLVAV
jgi:ABC-type dipeptide/oligopeptide/nickel transport system permease component